jgi:hypothetical protein
MCKRICFTDDFGLNVAPKTAKKLVPVSATHPYQQTSITR